MRIRNLIRLVGRVQLRWEKMEVGWGGGTYLYKV